VLVLSGYGLHVGVNRGQLVVRDGIGRTRRSGTLHRATCGLKRLVVLGHSGTVTLEALRWLHDIGAAFVQLDADGLVIIANGPSRLDDARLRRAQALATTNGVGIAIARELLGSKLDGQLAVLERLPQAGAARQTVQPLQGELTLATSTQHLRSLEARAAAVYWGAWASVEMPFARKDRTSVPEHWTTFGTRSSPLTGAPRTAANPINALLNYAYAILAAEVRLAVLTMGLDPGMGILHADQKSRDSFVLDVIEPLRPVVDGWLLDLLDRRTFGKREFFETRQGACRLMPPLPQALAEMSPRFGKLAGPVVEQGTQCLTQGQGAKVQPLTIPTLLTQANRSAGRDAVRTAPKREMTSETLTMPATCRGCGVLLAERDRHYCEPCWYSDQQEQAASFSAGGRTKLAELLAAGHDPAHGEEAAKKRGRKMRECNREQALWEARHEAKHDPDQFRSEILPGLYGVSLSAMVEATGLSEPYCSQIRRGLKVPHRRHWESFCGLSGSTDSPG
jgi:CRISPR-associated endonuclease Cas1